jgi:pimeloyl-ACP methyl ester carboxylesterase
MQSTNRAWPIFFAATSLFALVGCGDPVNPAPPPPNPNPQPAALPRFEEVACPTPLPKDLIEGQNVRCGELLVLEDRARADGPQLKLHVMIVQGSDKPKPDPIVHLIGGPGGAVQSYDTVLGGDFGLGFSARVGRDFILFDQRGTGRSTPRLTCPSDVLNEKCAEALAADGIDLAAYNSEESAADVEDLRIALGVPTINLYGQSYGTLLAQTVMRRFPQSIRSVMLESTSAVAHDVFFTNSPKAFQISLERVFAECAADPDCKAAFPDPAADVEAILIALDANGIDPAGFLGLVQLHLQYAQGVSYVPLLLRSLAAGDNVTFGAINEIGLEYQALFENALKGFNPVMYNAMNCYDYLPLYTDENNMKVNGDAAPAFQNAFGQTAADAKAACAALPDSRVTPEQQLPVQSALPTLLLAGTHDSNTPLEIAQKLDETLSNAYLVEMKGWGHLMLVLGNSCAADTYAEFIDNPSQKPAPACLATAKTMFPTKIP